jgi:hypothetical protein
MFSLRSKTASVFRHREMAGIDCKSRANVSGTWLKIRVKTGLIPKKKMLIVGKFADCADSGENIFDRQIRQTGVCADCRIPRVPGRFIGGGSSGRTLNDSVVTSYDE